MRGIFQTVWVAAFMVANLEGSRVRAAEQLENPVPVAGIQALIMTGTNSAANADTNVFALTTEVRREAAPGMRTLTRAYINSAAYRFGVEVPAGYRLQASSPDQVTLVTTDLTTALKFRIAGKATDDAKSLKPAFFRDLVLEQHAGAKILEEFIMPAAGKAGAAFDLQMAGSQGTLRKARVAFVPTEAGVLQFTVEGNAEKFKAALADFQTLLLTFRSSDADGKLKMPPQPLKI